MINFRAMLAAGGATNNITPSIDWSNYSSTNDVGPVTFSTNYLSSINVSKIDNERSLLIYRGITTFCTARIFSIDSLGNVTFGDETIILNETMNDCDAQVMTSSSATAIIRLNGIVKVVAFDFSEMSITSTGTAVTIESVTALFPNIVKLSSNEVIFGYKGVNNTGWIGYASISGTVVTLGGLLQYNSLNILHMAMCDISDDLCLLAYSYSNIYAYSKIALLSKSGTTPQIIGEVDLLDGSANHLENLDIKAIDEDRALITWKDRANSRTCSARIVTVSGATPATSTLSRGAVQLVNATRTDEISIAIADENHAVLSWAGGNYATVESAVLEITSDSINALAKHTNLTGNKRDITSIASNNKVISFYYDGNDGSKGKYILLSAE